jgi:hypothetical protein
MPQHRGRMEPSIWGFLDYASLHPDYQLRRSIKFAPAPRPRVSTVNTPLQKRPSSCRPPLPILISAKAGPYNTLGATLIDHRLGRNLMARSGIPNYRKLAFATYAPICVHCGFPLRYQGGPRGRTPRLRSSELRAGELGYSLSYVSSHARH